MTSAVDIGKDILKSAKNWGKISELMEMCQTVSHQAMQTLCHVLATIKTDVKTSNEKIISWFNEIKTLFVDFLLESLDKEGQFAVSALNGLFALLQAESLSQTKTDQKWFFDASFFYRIMQTVFEKDRPQLKETLATLLLHADIRYYFFKFIITGMKGGKLSGLKRKHSDREEVAASLIEMLLSVETEDSKEAQALYCAFDIKPLESQGVSQLSSRRALFGKAWLAILRSPLEEEAHKKILLSMHKKIIPRMTQPELLIDFLTDSYNSGGVLSLLALNSLFILIQRHNLYVLPFLLILSDYPDFFKKLYALIDRNILHVKYRSRFFRLLGLFLSSTTLTSLVVAAFIKKLARVCLHAPPSAIMTILPMIYNLLKQHPSCIRLIHHSEALPANYQGFSNLLLTKDPYLFAEADPEQSNAMDSFLWEVVTLKAHYCASVAKMAKIFEQQLTLPPFELENYLDSTYFDLFGTESKLREEWKMEVLNNKMKKANITTVEEDTANKTHAPAENQPASETESKRSKALELYVRATQYERMGNLSSALKLYMEATRMDKDVEIVYRKEHSKLPDMDHTNAPYYTYYDFASHEKTSDPTTSFLSWSESVGFVPRNESRPVYLDLIPNELTIEIIKWTCLLDMANLLNLSLASKKMYLLTRDMSLWRKLSEIKHRSSGDNLYEELPRYSNWYRLFLEKPCIKLNGVYISRVNYIRQGYGDSFNQPIHMVTYYRYLRFFPKGIAICITSTLEPHQIVRQLDGSPMKGLMRGFYMFQGDQVSLELKDSEHPRRSFQCTLTASTAKQGRNHKLSWVNYTIIVQTRNSVNVSQVPLQTLRPFHFSKVKSYTV